MENKDAICNALAETLKLTRNQQDLDDLYYMVEGNGDEIVRLCEAINAVIAQGIRNHGTTFRDYKDGEGNKGDNQNHLLVYSRSGEPCKECGATLLQTKIGGRGSVYCPHCQQ